MAIDYSKLNFFSRLSARSRVLVLFGVVIFIIFLIYLGTRYMFGVDRTTGPSRVANAPSNLQSVPGGQVSSAYYQALVQANQQKEQQARMSGSSAIPTMINSGQATTGNCNIICSDQSANVKDLLDNWVRSGKITPETAQYLQDLANRNVPVSQYEAELARLVREGKLTPEQARELLEQYKKQHANAALQESANMMDQLIKSGQLPLDAANELLAAQKRGVTPEEYAAILQRMVREGKISPETAAKLLAQYQQQRAKEAQQENLATIDQMAANGEITPDVAKQLKDFAARNPSVDDYNRYLQNLVAQGKLTPAAAAKLLDAYKRTHPGISNPVIEGLIKNAEAAAYKEVADLLKAGKINSATAAAITSMIQRNVSLDEFKANIASLVQQKALPPEIAPLKIADYTRVKQLRDQAARLAALAAANASPQAYADELRRAVANGTLTPEQAAQMLRDYQALHAPTTVTAAPGTPLADLQARIQQAPTPNLNVGETTGAFTQEQLQAQQAAATARAEKISAMQSAMQTQAGQLITAWGPPSMAHREGSYKLAAATTTTTTTGAATETTTTTTTTGSSGAPLIKAGTIIFGVLDTQANSDYPDSPVMVTIVEGQFKGAKLLGKLTTTKGVAGQLDRIALNFTLMNSDTWDKSRSVTAYAIDPDTARTVMASSVNYHYLLRYGAIFATSFVQGYANAIQTSGSSTTTGIFGTSTTHPQLSPSEKLMTAIGQIGQNLAQTTQNYINIPPTVKVNAGVSLGILFMSDVSSG